jgi:hypothetical protein
MKLSLCKTLGLNTTLCTITQMAPLQAIQDVGPENLQKKAELFRSKTVTAGAALNYSREADSTAKMAAATANKFELIQAYRSEMREL